MKKTDIWVLSDNRAGNTGQAIALAEALGLSFEIKKAKFNLLAKLPNFFFEAKPWHISNLKEEFDITNPPRLVISSGRRTAPLATYLKKISPSPVKVVQIMRPMINLQDIDLIILPEHDYFNNAGTKVIRITGALNNVNLKIKESTHIIAQHYPRAKNFIAVLIGGSTRRFKFEKKEAEELSKILSNIIKNQHLSLFISFSRRTPESAKKVIISRFSDFYDIYDPEVNKPNPYFAMLGEAKFIITTADSISMCSEAASSGRPLYIYCPAKHKLIKHRFFIQQLLDLNIARILKTSTNLLEPYEYTALNEVEKVASYIRLELL